MKRYLVKRWYEGMWMYLMPGGGWNPNRIEARRWTSRRVAEQMSTQHPGSIVEQLGDW